jgi:hypothetical protein
VERTREFGESYPRLAQRYRLRLNDLLGIDTALVNNARLYRALDQLGAHKDDLCPHLMARYRAWFGMRFMFLRDDVTSAFFEGQAQPSP